MEKTKRVLAILMAVLMVATAFPMNVFAAASENDPIVLSKTEFTYGESIIPEVYSGSGNSKDWIGLYHVDDPTTYDPNEGGWRSIAWCYVNEVTSSTDFSVASSPLQSQRSDSHAYYSNGFLIPGNYRLVYFENDGYTVFGTKAFTVSGDAPEVDYTPALSVNKTTYCVGEDILVTANGCDYNWVGLYPASVTPATDNKSYYWYYVLGDSGNGVNGIPGKAMVMQNTVAGGAHDKNKPIPAGEYKVCFFETDDQATIMSSLTKYITIKEHGESTETGIDKATFEADGAVNATCNDCGAPTVKEVIGKATAELEKTAYEQTGNATNAKVIVKDGNGNALTEGTDYTVAFANNGALTTDTSKATATVTLNNARYTGSITLEYDIITSHTHVFERTVTVKASFDKEGKIETACNVCPVVDEAKTVVLPAITTAVLEKSSYVYTGSEFTPAVTLKDSKGTALVKDTDFTVSYANNKEKGTATATVTLKKANYEGSKELTFAIGGMEVEKSVYNIGEAIKVKAPKTDNNLDWIGIYAIDETVALGSYLPFFYFFVNDFNGEYVDISNFSEKVVDSTSTRGNFYSYWGSETLFKPGEYKIVYCLNNSYDITYQQNITVLEKEIPTGVAISTDKASYNESETINVTVTNGTTKDSVAIYKNGSDVPAKKVMLSADGKAAISAQYLDSGSYKAVLLLENLRDYPIAEASFTVSRNSALTKKLIVNKTKFCGAEEIKVTAVGTGSDWVGIFNTTDLYNPDNGGQAAYYWYYANSWSKSNSTYFYGVGDEVVLNTKQNLGSRSGYEFGNLEPGLYKVVLFEDGGYQELSKVEIEIVGHSYKELSKTESTCTVKGSASYKCDVCGYETSQELDLADHKWNDGTLVSAATCSKDSVMNYTCTVCGENDNLSISGSATGHNYKLVGTVDGTCLVPGIKKYSCSNPGCDAPEKTEEVVISHEFEEMVITDPTCTKEGLKKNVCKWCSTSEGDGTVIPATGHNFVEDAANSVAADCTKDGVKAYKCSLCSETKTEAGESKKDHSFKEVVTPATVDADGKTEFKCETCGKVLSETTINKVSDITLDKTKFTFDNTAKKPFVTVRDSAGKQLKENTDYTIEYKDNVAVGTGKVVIKLTGAKYTGEKTLEFTIAAAGSSTEPTTKPSGGSTTEPTTKPSGGSTTEPTTKPSTDTTTPGGSTEPTTKPSGGSTTEPTTKPSGSTTTPNTTEKVTVSVANAKTAVTVSWKKVSGATKYTVKRRAYKNKKWSAYTTLGTTTSLKYSDKKASAGTKYQYQIVVAEGTSKGSTGASAEIVRLKRASVTVTNSKSAVTVKWAKVTGAKKYEVYRSLYSNKKWGKYTKLTTTTKTSYSDKKAKAGKKYRYKVVVVNSKSKSADSDAKTIVRLKRASVTVTNAKSAVTVKWSKVTGAKKYIVYRAVYNGKKLGKYSKLTTTTKTSYTDKKAKAGKKYSYKVVVVNGSYKSAETVKTIVRLAATKKVTVKKASKGVAVSWSKVTGAKGYYVYRSEKNGKKWTKETKVGTVKSAKTVKYTDKKAKKGKTYKYTVKAYSGDSTGYAATSKSIKR